MKNLSLKLCGRARLVRAAIIGTIVLASLLVLSTGVIGYAHTPSGRSTSLGRFVMTTLASACPVVGMSAETAEGIRQNGLAKLRGHVNAPERPLPSELANGGLALDHSSQADIEFFMQHNGYRCDRSKIGFEVLTCERSRDLPKAQLLFTFSTGGALVSLEIYKTDLTARVAERELTLEATRLRRRLGVPQRESNVSDRLSSLSDNYGGAYVEYRFADYLVDLTVIRLDDQISLRERYTSASKPELMATQNTRGG